MAIPDYQTLMLPLLRLVERQASRVPDVSERLADEFKLSAEERAELLPSGRQRLIHNRVHWAKFYLSKAGLLELPSRGLFVATEAGRELLSRAPPRISVATLKEYSAFREYYERFSQGPALEAPETAPVSQPSLETPEELIESAHSDLQKALKEDLVQRILANSPSFFEKLIVDLLVAMGYGGTHKTAALQLGGTGDGGVDGVISEDRLGLDRVYVQAKRYARSASVGRPDVQAFVGSLVGLGATKGVFFTTSSFSAPAVEFVKHLSQRVILIDGEHLSDLMVEHNVGVRVSRSLEFKRLDEDFFSDED